MSDIRTDGQVIKEPFGLLENVEVYGYVFNKIFKNRQLSFQRDA